MEEAEDGFLEHTAARESGQWAQMRAAKNRRLCTSIREALDGVQRQHQVELRNHRYDVAMRRHESELARTRSAKETRDALKQNAVKEVLPVQVEFPFDSLIVSGGMGEIGVGVRFLKGGGSSPHESDSCSQVLQVTGVVVVCLGGPGHISTSPDKKLFTLYYI